MSSSVEMRHTVKPHRRTRSAKASGYRDRKHSVKLHWRTRSVNPFGTRDNWSMQSQGQHGRRDAGAYDATPGAAKASHEGRLGCFHTHSGHGSRYVTRHLTAHPASPHPPLFRRLTLHGWGMQPWGTEMKDEGCHARTLTCRTIYVCNGTKQWGTCP